MTFDKKNTTNEWINSQPVCMWYVEIRATCSCYWPLDSDTKTESMLPFRATSPKNWVPQYSASDEYGCCQRRSNCHPKITQSRRISSSIARALSWVINNGTISGRSQYWSCSLFPGTPSISSFVAFHHCPSFLYILDRFVLGGIFLKSSRDPFGAMMQCQCAGETTRICKVFECDVLKEVAWCFILSAESPATRTENRHGQNQSSH